MKSLISSFLLIGFSANIHATSVLCSYSFVHNGIGGSTGMPATEMNCVFKCPLNVPSPALCQVIRGPCAAPTAVSWYSDGQWGVMEFENQGDMFCKVSRK